MALQHRGYLRKKVEDIVSHPKRATLVVGTSILLLLGGIRYLQSYWQPVIFLTLLIPYIPPFFTARVAKTINQRDAEHDFIKDAEPYIFVAFPNELTLRSLMNTTPEMLSNSAARHLNCTIEELLQREALPSGYISDDQRRRIIQLLLDNYEEEAEESSIRHKKVYIKRSKKEDSLHLYLMSSKLEKEEDKIKWQATLMEYDPLQETPSTKS